MVETDWRQILSFSQRELNQNDKEKLCESLSWMEADDIELNFSDLKTLFRLAQDILKFKNEQVNNLLGEIQTIKKKSGKKKSKTPEGSPARSSDSAFETIAQQEEIIRANKEVLKQLYEDIAELEGRKDKLERENNFEKESDSSKDALSEMNAIEELENEITKKNKHIRKLLTDVKFLEEENIQFKEKTTDLKDKLTEATQIIENLTEQLLSLNVENNQLKEALGRVEESKTNFLVEIEELKKELEEKHSLHNSTYENLQAKVQHWKEVAKSRKAANLLLSTEYAGLRNNLQQATYESPKIKLTEEAPMKELQMKLAEASNKITQSAKIIETLRSENNILKSSLNRAQDFLVTETRNECDDGKERVLIKQLKIKVNSLNVALKGAEEMIEIREKELSEITAQLQLIQSGEEGLAELLQGLKSKKRQLKLKDEGIKSLVQEVNALSEAVDRLELENETLRHKLKIAPNINISTKGTLRKYKEIEQDATRFKKEVQKLENKLVTLQLDNYNIKSKISNLTNYLINNGYTRENIEAICEEDNTDIGAGGDTIQENHIAENKLQTQTIIEENEGLRKALQELLEFLKDNSTSSSGILALQCPSLESVLQSMQARHAAGWFAPHMTAVLELRTALGGRDALLSALHEARNETFDVMTQLSKESQKCQELKVKLNEIENNFNSENNKQEVFSVDIFDEKEFGNWISAKDIDYNERQDVNKFIAEGNSAHQNHLKKSLAFFHNQFKLLFDKMTAISIEASDNRNKWSVLEENYKAEIQQLKSQVEQRCDEDKSDDSPGLINYTNPNILQRKCDYLEESYKYIRTLNENIKNEYFELQKEHINAIADYEIKIQTIILSITSLTDKLRNSIPIDMFWKQHDAYYDVVTKFRQKIQQESRDSINSINLLNLLKQDKVDIINVLQSKKEMEDTESEPKKIMSEVEHTILQKQIERLCAEIEDKTSKLNDVERKNFELQETQSKIINDTLKATSLHDVELYKEQLEKVTVERNALKHECKLLGNQLEIALLQLKEDQQKQMNNDIEINMLRHQILDLQSAGDNKAIIARLSTEILVSHLQASESHKTIERLRSDLAKENQKRLEAEDMLNTREKIFNVYANRYESKFRYIYDISQVLREQYQGAIPLTSLENYQNSLEDLFRKNKAADAKLNEIEDLQASLMMKHSVFDQILNASKERCLDEEERCPHQLRLLVIQGLKDRETEHFSKKIRTLEETRESLLTQCSQLEKTLVLINQVYDNSAIDFIGLRKGSIEKNPILNLELEDIHSDEDSDSGSHTVTLSKPRLLKTPKDGIDMTKLLKENFSEVLPGSPGKEPKTQNDKVDVVIQTTVFETSKNNRATQTDTDETSERNKHQLTTLQTSYDIMAKELSEAMTLVRQRSENMSVINTEKNNLETVIDNLRLSVREKERLNDHLQNEIKILSDELREIRAAQAEDSVRNRIKESDETKSLLSAFKNLEEDKNTIVEEYKEMLKNEREEYAKSMRELNLKVLELQSQNDRKGSDTSNAEAVREIHDKYSMKIVELEDERFKLRSDLDGCKSELLTYQSESQRWKELASERLVKMEQLSSQLEQRHFHEVETYKAENEHWIAQLAEGQKERAELRGRLTEQRAAHATALAEKDTQLEQLRSVVHNLKTQLMSMQTVMSVADPSFDLSAILEAEDSEGSQPDRLEIRFDSTADLRDDLPRFPSSSTAIWQESLIERLRREKQMLSKQNGILRRQIKALAARERRARLEAQNLKNQVFRISTSGTKVATAESMSLQAKIANLQSQLSSARRDTQSSVALWDKWKRAQQASERWQAKYEEKCREVTKLETSMNFARSAVTRLEKEKRILMSRLSESRLDKQTAVFEKQEHEVSEKDICESPELDFGTSSRGVSMQALLDRVEAQQRRIAALELADKGNEPLMTEYERSLAEITSLKGQVLKLESALLESQIQTPIRAADHQPELEYWKSYCNMLKEENVQLGMRLSALETSGASAGGQRVSDLEKTVLTLRSLVSKLQAEQKSMTVLKRGDSGSRPGSGKSSTIDKNRSQLESYRIEIANLKRSIEDKDNLLEKSKQMLKIAAEREEELLRENSYLQRQIEELTRPKGGFFSA